MTGVERPLLPDCGRDCSGDEITDTQHESVVVVVMQAEWSRRAETLTHTSRRTVGFSARSATGLSSGYARPPAAPRTPAIEERTTEEQLSARGGRTSTLRGAAGAETG